MRRINRIVAVGVCMFLGTGAVALADKINTGSKKGAYHTTFCPLVAKALEKAQFNYKCTTSNGSRENIQRTSTQSKQIGFSQLDVFALETPVLGGQASFSTIRTDIGRECLFLVTKNKKLTNFGQVAASANELHFILPPEDSGHTGTFEFLQQIDPDGLGKGKNISFADSMETALDAVLTSSDDTAITIFVQFPDPNNALFKKIARSGGRFIPVIDRNILRQQIAGEKIYYPQETEVVNANWIKKGEKVVTACTPIVLFTGHPDLLSEEKDRADHADLIKTLKDMDVSSFQPEQGYFSKLFKQTREISSKGVEKMLEVSEDARDAAAPMMDKASKASKDAYQKAKEAGEDAMEKATPMLDKASEASKNALERAKEMGGKAMDKAGEMADEAKREAEKMMKDKE